MTTTFSAAELLAQMKFKAPVAAPMLEDGLADMVFADLLADMEADADEANALSDQFLSRPPVAPGMFTGDDGSVYVVKHTRDGQRLYAMKLVGDKYVYDRGAYYALKETARMGVDACEALSLDLGYCVMCSRALTAAKSVNRGMGPVCRKRVMGL